MEPLDPTHLDELNARARRWAADGETILPVEIQHVVVAEDTMDDLGDVVRSLSGSGRTLMVVDHTPMRRGNDDLKPLVEAALRKTVSLTVRWLPDDANIAFHADLASAEALAVDVADYAAVVAVGSGSITDVAKYACLLAAHKASRHIPFVCVPTAASVTAYTSALAVLLHDGCKRNFEARLPEAVVCDLTTLASAPAAMTQAGFADVLARSVAYGDWFLASQLGMDDTYSEVPGKLLEPAEQRMIDLAESMAAGELAGIRAVTEALLLAGMCMSVINHTAPVSGWEHVISHYLDMTAKHNGRSMALHGGQVGVATLISARAYDRAWPDLDLDRIAAELAGAEFAAGRRTIEQVFGEVDSTGKMVAELQRDYDKKVNRWRSSRDARRRFVARKRAGEYDENLRRLVRPSGVIRDALSRACAPQRFADLDRPIGRREAQAAVRYSHLVRSRFTLGDLLLRSGWLTSEAAEALLEEPA